MSADLTRAELIGLRNLMLHGRTFANLRPEWHCNIMSQEAMESLQSKGFIRVQRSTQTDKHERQYTLLALHITDAGHAALAAAGPEWSTPFAAIPK